MTNTKSLFVFLAILLTACGPKPVELKGEVFIVTQGAGNYKLGLVKVVAIPEKTITSYIAGLKSADEDKNRTAVDTEKQKFTQISTSYDKAIERYNRAKNADSIESLTEMRWASQEVDGLKTQLDASSAKLSAAINNLNSVTGAERYFASLPAATAAGTTDSDGKFSVIVPKPGKYAIVAQAERKIGSETEKYYWMVWVDANEPKTITLSNNNLTDSGSPDSLLKTVSLDPKSLLTGTP
jgi:hypothetical protein